MEHALAVTQEAARPGHLGGAGSGPVDGLEVVLGWRDGRGTTTTGRAQVRAFSSAIRSRRAACHWARVATVGRLMRVFPLDRV